MATIPQNTLLWRAQIHSTMRSPPINISFFLYSFFSYTVTTSWFNKQNIESVKELIRELGQSWLILVDLLLLK